MILARPVLLQLSRCRSDSALARLEIVPSSSAKAFLMGGGFWATSVAPHIR